MQAREKEEHWNFLPDKRGVIARRVSAGGIFDMELGLALLFIEEILERGSRSSPADKNFLVLDPADHVHVDHGDGFVERQRRLLHPLRGTEQPQFLSSKVRKENAALQ